MSEAGLETILFYQIASERLGTDTPKVEDFISTFAPRNYYAYTRMLHKIDFPFDSSLDIRVDLKLMFTNAIGGNEIYNPKAITLHPGLFMSNNMEYTQKVLTHEIGHSGKTNENGVRVISEGINEHLAQKKQKELEGRDKLETYEEETVGLEAVFEGLTYDEAIEELTRKVSIQTEVQDNDLTLVNNFTAMVTVKPAVEAGNINSFSYDRIRSAVRFHAGFINDKVSEHLTAALSNQRAEDSYAQSYMKDTNASVTDLDEEGILYRAAEAVFENAELEAKLFDKLFDNKVMLSENEFNDALKENGYVYLLDFKDRIKSDGVAIYANMYQRYKGYFEFGDIVETGEAKDQDVELVFPDIIEFPISKNNILVAQAA